MLSRKGYVGLAFLSLLIVAFYLVTVYNSRVVEAAACTNFNWCDGAQNCPSCDNTCERCQATGSSCLLEQVEPNVCIYALIRACVDTTVCGNDICEDNCQDADNDETTDNCPEDCTQQPDCTPQTCSGTYQFCQGTNLRQCTQGCQGSFCVDTSCSTISNCNPSVACYDARYESAARCIGTACAVGQGADCGVPTEACFNSTHYRVTDRGCVEPTGCVTPTLGTPQACSVKSGWYLGSTYPCCDGTRYSATCRDDRYRTYTACSGGSCQYSITNTRTVVVQRNTDCNALDGWYNMAAPVEQCYNATYNTSAQRQRHRDYSCNTASPSSCSFVLDGDRYNPVGTPTMCPRNGRNFCRYNDGVTLGIRYGNCNQTTDSCDFDITDVICPYGCFKKAAPADDVCNDRPVVRDVYYTGTCTSGGSITVFCNVTDAQNNTHLNVTAWIGQCTPGNCASTASWITGTGIIIDNVKIRKPPNFQSIPTGNELNFSYRIASIPLASGQQIAARCRPEDSATNGTMVAVTPLCTIGCGSPVTVTVTSATPPAARVGTTVRVTFRTNTESLSSRFARLRSGNRVYNASSYQHTTGTLDYTGLFNVDASFVEGTYDSVADIVGTGGCAASDTGTTVRIDKTAPTTTITCNGGSCATNPLRACGLTVNLACSDNFACDDTRYRQNTGAWATGNSFNLAGTGQYNVTYYSNDTAGNTETQKVQNIRYESTCGCTGVTCNVPEDACISATVLRDYTSSRCIDGACVNFYTDINCAGSCMAVSGPDVCTTGQKPVLVGLTMNATYLNYAKAGNSVIFIGNGSDPIAQQVRLRCGTSARATDVCTGNFMARNPTCTISVPWNDNANHQVYCYIDDTEGLLSDAVLSVILIADNAAPSVSATKTPSSTVVNPNSIVNFSVTASDTGSGVATTMVVLNGTVRNSCAATSCALSYTATYSRYWFHGNATDRVGNRGSTADAYFTANNLPNVLGPAWIPPEYSCTTGGTIRVNCSVSDPNTNRGLRANVWVGECNPSNCFATRSWSSGTGTTYLNNAVMTSTNGNNTFASATISLTSVSGTGIAATCRATDELLDQNLPATQGDAYPICVVGCVSPVTVTITSIQPNSTPGGNVDISFTLSRAVTFLEANVTPGYDRGLTTEYRASLLSQNGLNYVYRFDATGRAEGSALVTVRAIPSDNCAGTSISEFIIDRTPPTTTAFCNLQPCVDDEIYASPLQITFACADTDAGCSWTQYGIDAPASTTYNPSNPPEIIDNGYYTINYYSQDNAGQNENPKSVNVRVYSPAMCGAVPCVEEMKTIVKFDNTFVVRGEMAHGRIYCIIRDANSLDMLIRECEPDPASLDIIVDAERDYLANEELTGEQFLINNRNAGNAIVNDGGNVYDLTTWWDLNVDTDRYQSTFCANLTDNSSGYDDVGCGGYTTADFSFIVEVTHPDVESGLIPLTTDGFGAPNFTKLMPLNFRARPFEIAALGGKTLCGGVNCRVEYQFGLYGTTYVTEWNAFENAYTPKPQDILSNSFTCDDYVALYVNATILVGPNAGVTANNQSDIFISCDPRLTVMPPEARYAIGQQAGKVFDVTIWNPSDTSKNYDLLAQSLDSKTSYPLPWTNFNCAASECAVDPFDNDRVYLNVSQMNINSVRVEMPKALKAGSFPVIFVATEFSTSEQLSGAGTILIFSEGLEEFATWQLMVLIGAAAYLLFFKIG